MPGAAQDTVSGVISANDYLLTEPSPPPGWTLESITCDVLDPATGARSSVRRDQRVAPSGGPQVHHGLHHHQLRPGDAGRRQGHGPAGRQPRPSPSPAHAPEDRVSHPSRCLMEPAADSRHPVTRSPSPRQPPPAGRCRHWTARATTRWSPTRDGDKHHGEHRPGEQVVCTFVNADNGRDPTQACLLVEKAVPSPTARLDFTVGTLTPTAAHPRPPDPARHPGDTSTPPRTAPPTPSPTVPIGWELQSATSAARPGDRWTPPDPPVRSPSSCCPTRSRTAASPTARATTRSPDHHQGHDARRWDRSTSPPTVSTRAASTWVTGGPHLR